LAAYSSTGLAASSPAPAKQAATPTPSFPRDPQAAALLAQQGATISYRAQTGIARFIAANPAQPIQPSTELPATASFSQAARSFVAQYGKLFGVKDQSQELTVAKETTPDKARAFVRFQQVYQGIPVFGGELNVQLPLPTSCSRQMAKSRPTLTYPPPPAWMRQRRSNQRWTPWRNGTAWTPPH